MSLTKTCYYFISAVPVAAIHSGRSLRPPLVFEVGASKVWGAGEAVENFVVATWTVSGKEDEKEQEEQENRSGQRKQTPEKKAA